MLNRRGLITGLISLVAAPAIIRVNHLMPISVVEDINVATNPMWKTRYLWKRISVPIFSLDQPLRTGEWLMTATDQEMEEMPDRDLFKKIMPIDYPKSEDILD